MSSERVYWKGDSTTVYKVSHGNDGISVSGSDSKNGAVRKFEFWSPKKNSENYQFVQNVFSVTDESFKKKKPEVI